LRQFPDDRGKKKNQEIGNYFSIKKFI
jgi:hypothetical protein